LREGGLADITFVILIRILAGAEDIGAIVTFVVFVGVVMNGAAATAGEIAGCQGKNGCNGKHCGEK
jgi:hypothetical protein